MGFYHGVQVKSGGKMFVMGGPPAVFVAEALPDRPAQTSGTAGQLELFS
jgi:hypothetical protein